MISPNSRYRNSATVLIDVGGDVRKTIVSSPQADWTFTYTEHQVRNGERVDILARRYYGNEQLWWNIADANPEILDWSTLTPGAILRVPRV